MPLPEKEKAKREDDSQSCDGGCDTDAGFCTGAESGEVGGGVPDAEGEEWRMLKM